MAQQVLQDGRPQTVPYSLVDAARGDPGVCGGEVEVYLERYQPPTTLLILAAATWGRRSPV
ncbi:MAG: hypothetical protein M5U34_33650 [Chloroflexi bacterium]|nr:hypothetical protein [Chloroflexota bacterium]